MASYKIEWKASAEKDLRSLDKPIIQRIIAAISELEKNALPAGAIKLQGAENTYRVRVGDYRIVYQFQKPDLIVIAHVRHRKDVYRNM